MHKGENHSTVSLNKNRNKRERKHKAQEERKTPDYLKIVGVVFIVTLHLSKLTRECQREQFQLHGDESLSQKCVKWSLSLGPSP